MTFWEMLHQVILGPIDLLLDVVFSFGMQLSGNPAVSIVVLSLAVNLLVLPLYLRADALQMEEKETAERLQPRIRRIRAAFRGDERFMILQTYYRQNHYKPYYVLRSSVSLLLQIPFFMSAYSFLSGLKTLQGVELGPIADLGAPDGMLTIGGLAINLLPILMTVINLISGALYTRGMPLKSKVQLYGMALVFLVILYDSPSGLVLYWTLNNVFSLIKNIFYKLPQPKKAVRILCAVIGLMLLVPVFYPGLMKNRQRLAVLIVIAALELPLLLEMLRGKGLFGRAPAFFRLAGKAGQNRAAFWLSGLLLAVLTGVLIPSAVIQNSPGEFIDAVVYANPLRYIGRAFLTAAGTFLVWMGIYFQLASERAKRIFGVAVPAAALGAAVTYMFFSGGRGNMSSMLRYDIPLVIPPLTYTLNLAAVTAVCLAVFLLWKKKPALLRAVCLAGCVAVVAMSGVNLFDTQAKASEIKKVYDSAQQDVISIPLDKKGKNVVVIMLDRAIGGYVPYLLNEKPELREQFDGFTWYPNTLSYGCHTNVGAPPLYGGYEYTPAEMAARADETLVKKHNESLRVMPVSFLERGFEVTVCDPPYANYYWISDLSIYDDYPAIRKANILGKVNPDVAKVRAERDRVRNRNFYCYGLLLAAPSLIQPELYNEGYYNETDAVFGPEEEEEDPGVTSQDFLDSYYVLKNLDALTEITDTGRNTFLMMTNNTTHEIAVLQEPEYVPKRRADNSEYEATHGLRYAADGSFIDIGGKSETVQKHYQCDMAAFLQLGRWFAYLKQNGLYDNTRIILVSDHGYGIEDFGFELMSKADGARYPGAEQKTWRRTESYNPLLLVKDFGAKGALRTDRQFMTNADTPTLAFEGVIENPVNPFTGKPITPEAKEAEAQYLVESNWHIEENNGNMFADPAWITVRNRDIFNPANWSVAQPGQTLNDIRGGARP